MIAVNVFPQIPLDEWERYWRQVAGSGGVIFAQDTRREAIRALDVSTAGATVILDEERRVAFRDRYTTSYEDLKRGVAKANGRAP